MSVTKLIVREWIFIQKLLQWSPSWWLIMSLFGYLEILSPLDDRYSLSPVRHTLASPVDRMLFPSWIKTSWQSLSPSGVHSFCTSLVKVSLHHSHFWYLRSKICVFWYLSLFYPVETKIFNLHISGRRNLNRGICHTPIFDLRYHLISYHMHHLHH